MGAQSERCSVSQENKVPDLAGDCAPLSHVLDEGQKLLLSPEQMKEERL